MSRALDLRLEPASAAESRLEIATYTYAPETCEHASMTEEVALSLDFRGGYFLAELTPDEARVLANQLLQVADACDAHRAEREQREEAEAEEQRQRDIEHDLVRQAEERGEEYVPGAIGAEHIAAIEAALDHGAPLRWWQADLVQGDPRLARCQIIPRREAPTTTEAV